MGKSSCTIISNARDVKQVERTVSAGEAFNHVPNASLFFVRTAMQKAITLCKSNPNNGKTTHHISQKTKTIVVKNAERVKLPSQWINAQRRMQF